MRPVLYRVAGSVRETEATSTLTLEPAGGPDEEAVDPIAPGQFNMLWSWGIGEAPISASAAPPTGELVHTIRDVGGVTRALCSARRGDIVGVRGPFGRGWDVESAKGGDLVIVAGGIGLAPLRPVVHEVLADRSAFGRVSLVVGARTSGELLFRSELDGWWQDRSITVRTIVDRATPDWHGNVGVVTNELPRVTTDPERTVAMVCGPEVMMRFVAMHLAERGVPPDRIGVSLERNMQCAIEHCGHCQLAGYFVCTDGPVVSWGAARPLLEVREL